MTGASSGHGAAWPFPSIVSFAFHAALHRATFEGVHLHVPGHASLHRDYSTENRENNGRKFGSLTTVGPFPVDPKGNWFFPRPADAGRKHSTAVSLFPLFTNDSSSLPHPLEFSVANIDAPNKESVANWWSVQAWNSYLQGGGTQDTDFKTDREFADTEQNYGIGLSPDTGTVETGAFYSAHYLRLREGCRLGVFASAVDKDFRHKIHGNDLIRSLLNGGDAGLIIGGQQRICTAEINTQKRSLPLPIGAKIVGTKVKWVLLSPGIWPEIKADTSSSGEEIHSHPGGWLPNWVASASQTSEGQDVKAGAVLLLDGPGRTKAKRKRCEPGTRIAARLVAATVSKPVSVSGYAVENSVDPARQKGGDKSTHLAVPAGSVYYFEADTEEDARKLAVALNWHGSDLTGQNIQNRRSTLMGEKGFGLGVCGNWNFHPASAPR